MKYLLLISVCLSFIQCSNSKKTQNFFLGSWEYNDSNNKDALQNNTFSIKLNSKNDSIIGNYCSITRGGSRIDCFDEKTKNVKGKIINDTLYVVFFSSFNGSKGNAKLFFKNKKLIWSVGDFEGESLVTDIPLTKVK